MASRLSIGALHTRPRYIVAFVKSSIKVLLIKVKNVLLTPFL